MFVEALARPDAVRDITWARPKGDEAIAPAPVSRGDDECEAGPPAPVAMADVA